MPQDRDVVLGGDDRGTTMARRGAALYDMVVVSWAIGVLAVPLDEVLPGIALVSLLVLWVVLVAVEAATGASPGKHVTGMRVESEAGERPTPWQAALRRPWGWLLPLQALGGPLRVAATLVAVVVAIAILVSIERSDDRRGFHDRLAGTRVLDGTFDRRARLVVVGVTVAVALLGLVLAPVLLPAPPA